MEIKRNPKNDAMLKYNDKNKSSQATNSDTHARMQASKHARTHKVDIIE